MILFLILLFSDSSVAAKPNGVLFQTFHWYTPSVAHPQAKGGLWKRLQFELPKLAQKGITAVWIPPASKAVGGVQDVGYGIYDRYDLGEFNQKGSVSTKYGTLAELQKVLATARSLQIDVYADIVMNHMMGADESELVPAVEVDPNNRNIEIKGTDQTIEAATAFQFPARGCKYSKFQWSWQHFTGIDWDRKSGRHALFKFRGLYPGFQNEVDSEFGNYDYLMGADIDTRHPQVQRELSSWGRWMVKQFGFAGFRLDAVKHIPFHFVAEWLQEVRLSSKRDLFAVAEYWSGDLKKLQRYLTATGGATNLFDVPLHYHLESAGRQNGHYDLRKIFDGTLVKVAPTFAVTFVDNHDTQPLQALQSTVPDHFKPQAYALTLLREAGYPTVFAADYYGAKYQDRGKTIEMHSFQPMIDMLLFARHQFAYGAQHDYFDHPDWVGWTRAGDRDHPGGLAVVISDHRTNSGMKRMCIPPIPGGVRAQIQRNFVDLTRSFAAPVALDPQGCGEFPVKPSSISVWADGAVVQLK